MPQGKFKYQSPAQQAKDLYLTYWNEKNSPGFDLTAFRKRLKAACHRISANPIDTLDDGQTTARRYLVSVGENMGIDITKWFRKSVKR